MARDESSMPRKIVSMLTSAVVVLLAAAGPIPPASAADEYDALRERWVHLMTGGEGLDVSDPHVSARIGSIEASAQDWWDKLDTRATRTHLWSDLTSTSSSSQITSAYTRLRDMSIALHVEGSDLYGNTTLRDDVLFALDWMLDHRYNTTVTSYGNWWDWQIGAPRALGDIVTLMYDSLSSAEITALLAPVDRFSPSVAQTGANRAWKAEVVAVSGFLTKNSTKLANARDGLSQLFDYVTTGDGFYRDGSFVQHGSIAYTGAYGRSLLVTVANLLTVLAGSSWEVTDPDIENVYAWVTDAFEPVIHDGVLMDMVRGREISRHYHQDVDAGRAAMEGILVLAEGAQAGQSTVFRSMVKEWLLADDAGDFFRGASLPGIVRAQAVLANEGLQPGGGVETYRQLANMDRAVVHRDDWALGIAMYSQRTGLYESINGENRAGWYTGAGTVYLYNGDRDHYSDEYWPTVDPYRLPGTTVDTGSRTPGSHNAFRNDRSWVGGVSLDGAFGATGMSYRDAVTDMLARKSWFVFDDEVVALGAGITNTSGNPVESIVENRVLNAAGDNTVRVNGAATSTILSEAATEHSGVTHLHIAGDAPDSDIGYYFPEPATVHAVREERTGSWRDIDARDTTPTTDYTRNYQTFWLDHGSNPTNETYAYTLLPGLTNTGVENYAVSPDIQVIANTGTVQAVEETGLGIEAANFWSKSTTTAGIITSNTYASVMTRQADGEISVAVSDPTQRNVDTIEIELDASASSVVAVDPRITVTQLSPTIVLSIDANGLDGAAVEARLVEGTPPAWDLVDVDLSSYASSGWTVYGPSGSVSQETGFASVSDTFTSSSVVLHKSGFVPPAGAFTMEARIRTHAGQTGFNARDDDFLATAQLTHGNPGTVKNADGTASRALDTTVWHDYRLVVHADRTSDLYLDGELVWADAPPGGGGTNILSFGVGQAATGTFDVDRVRVGMGEILP